jgi:hypothetical protein
MKYGSLWKNKVQSLPDTLQQYCISYKKWKKACKTPSVMDKLYLLEKECKDANDTFVDGFRYIYKKPKSCCYSSNFEHVKLTDLEAFAAINKTTLYKLCKRIDKRHKTSVFKNWLNQHFHQFSFNYGLYVTRLCLELSKQEHTMCPICLDDFDSETIFTITSCGHLLCYSCFCDLYKIHGKRGLIRNLVVCADVEMKIKCPICRSDRPYNMMSSLNIWPSRHAHILRRIQH